MYKLFKSKKGIGIDDLIPLLFTIIVFVIVIFFLNINNANKKRDADLNAKIIMDTIKAEQKLLDFLEKKVEVDKKTITIADLIRLYYYEEKHKDILVEEIKNMLNSLSKPALASGWNLHIYSMPEDKKIMDIILYDVLGWFEKEQIFTYIPLPNDPEKYIKLKLWLECQC